jgi:hypothetical protein
VLDSWSITGEAYAKGMSTGTSQKKKMQMTMTMTTIMMMMMDDEYDRKVGHDIASVQKVETPALTHKFHTKRTWCLNWGRGARYRQCSIPALRPKTNQ